jgi:hypothetical protein
VALQPPCLRQAFRQARACQIGIGQDCVGQHCAAEVSIAQIGAAQISAREVNPSQVSPGQAGVAQVAPHCAVIDQLVDQPLRRIDDGAVVENGAAQIDQAQVSQRQVRPAQVSASERTLL